MAPAAPPAPLVAERAPVQRTATRALASHRFAEIDVAESETARLLAPRTNDRRRWRGPIAAGRIPQLRLWDPPSGPRQLTVPITGATLSGEGGEALLASIAALPENRRALGLSGLTSAVLFGPDGNGGQCESISYDLPLTLDGVTYEGRYRTDPNLLMTRPVPVLYALSSTCTAALARTNGQVAMAVGSGCSREDEAAHFPAGSACRACLATDGDHARCRAAAACPAETARTMLVTESGRPTFYDVHEATVLACAPDIRFTQLLLVRDRGVGDPAIPAFDHSVVARNCGYYWNATANETRINCSPLYMGVRLAVADVVISRADYIRRVGDTRRPFARRTILAESVDLDGVHYDSFVLYPGTLAELSEADLYAGGYGFVPNGLRADGSDPTNLDHTHARDWIATVAMKTATTIDGVPIGIYNRNICRPDDWRGPDARGRFFCVGPYIDLDHPPPDDLLWQFDYGAFYVGINPTRIELLPTVTLAATGRMDPAIPGGHVPKVMGSPVLADPEWENCAWPDLFEPDEMKVADNEVRDANTFTTQTYRFGKDAGSEVRVVLATSWRRGFCFEPLE